MNEYPISKIVAAYRNSSINNNNSRFLCSLIRDQFQCGAYHLIIEKCVKLFLGQFFEYAPDHEIFSIAPYWFAEKDGNYYTNVKLKSGGFLETSHIMDGIEFRLALLEHIAKFHPDAVLVIE
jgi:hypothetical protein